MDKHVPLGDLIYPDRERCIQCGRCVRFQSETVDDPVIGPVQDAFSFWPDVAVPRGDVRWSLDLVKANRHELMQIGLASKNIHAAGICTSCRKDLFYSYRAEGKTGRMLSVIMLKP